MSFSNEGHGAGPTTASASPIATHPTFGQIFEHIISQKYPIAGGLAQMVFGGGNQAPAPMANPPMAPPVQMPTAQPVDYSSMIDANAQPKSGGGTGLKLLMSLLGA